MLVILPDEGMFPTTWVLMTVAMPVATPLAIPAQGAITETPGKDRTVPRIPRICTASDAKCRTFGFMFRFIAEIKDKERA